MVAARVRLRITHQAGGRIAPTSERDWIRLRLARQFVEQRRDAKGFKAWHTQRPPRKHCEDEPIDTRRTL
jgi:hypothetical protein